MKYMQDTSLTQEACKLTVPCAVARLQTYRSVASTREAEVELANAF
jgi:hypothetical protein